MFWFETEKYSPNFGPKAVCHVDEPCTKLIIFEHLSRIDGLVSRTRGSRRGCSRRGRCHRGWLLLANVGDQRSTAHPDDHRHASVDGGPLKRRSVMITIVRMVKNRWPRLSVFEREQFHLARRLARSRTESGPIGRLIRRGDDLCNQLLFGGLQPRLGFGLFLLLLGGSGGGRRRLRGGHR